MANPSLVELLTKFAALPAVERLPEYHRELLAGALAAAREQEKRIHLLRCAVRAIPIAHSLPEATQLSVDYLRDDDALALPIPEAPR